MLPDVNLISRRSKLVFGANIAHTPDQITDLKELVVAWLRLYPDDEIVKRAGRRLESAEARLRDGGWH